MSLSPMSMYILVFIKCFNQMQNIPADFSFIFAVIFLRLYV